MANPLFNQLFGNAPQIPQNAPVAPQMSMPDMMNQLRSNPSQMLKNAGLNVPDEIANNPQAMVMHLLQSGQVGGQAMQRIQPMLNMLMGRQ